jgi:hypothetical protein
MMISAEDPSSVLQEETDKSEINTAEQAEVQRTAHERMREEGTMTRRSWSGSP